ncbi:MAG TPA: ATP-dependent DNA helicase RecQ [Bacteroidia bacterium]|nr:ATP-dependent DNA helicase RecQ [Bacteroidia bacterium]
METIQQILTRYWGHTHFRPLQEDIINSVLEGKDTLALLPTGGGKSLCFQIPALTKDGICIVVSPLIALMKDQVEFLTKKGIRATMLHSFMSSREIDITLDNCIHGDYKFLYVSPERINTDIFQARVKQMNINLIAVDEAHCISQWGYDFRPAYLQISELRNLFPEIPVLALTGSATNEVVNDIQKKLSFRKPNAFRASYERKNVAYVVLKEESKSERLLKIVNNVKGTGIIYVRNRKKTEELAFFLRQNKISADFYHAGLNHEERNSKQEAWFQDRVRVMVCTNAFGMGINKLNVRFVVHLDLPDCLESYFQEAGRVGRDEKKAYAILLYNDTDRINLERNIDHSFPPIDEIKKTYAALCSYFHMAVGSGKGTTHDFDIREFCEKYSLEIAPTASSIKFLEKEGYIMATDSFYRPSKAHMLINNKDLYRFQVEHPVYDAFVKLLLRSYEGIFTNYVQINELELARRSTLSEAEVSVLLRRLDKMEVISYQPQSSKPQIIFTEDCLHASNVLITKQNYSQLKERTIQRMEWVIQYATTTDKCRSEMLLSYFGEVETVRCGICDVCLERNKLELSTLEFENIAEQLKITLSKKPMPLTDLIHSVQHTREDKTLKTVQWLLDNGKLQHDEDNMLVWKE